VQPAPAPAPAPAVTKPAVEPAPAPKPAAAPPAAAPVAATSADPLVGKPLYEANCRKCHGVIGVPAKAIKAKFPKILPFDADYFSKTTDAAVVTILMQGKGDDMKSFKDTLSKAEMAAVAAYIRTLGKP
jgi:mono/diheme cytochrome c family protein